MEEILTLTNKKTKKIKEPELLKIAIHLKTFIEGLTNKENKQKELLKIAVDSLKKFPIKEANPNCKHCFGRGFTGYDKHNKKFIPCSKCFKPKKIK